MTEPEKRISDFLDELAHAAALLATYWRDPDAAIRNSGLSAEHQELLRSGDLEGIRKAVARERNVNPADVELHVFVCGRISEEEAD